MAGAKDVKIQIDDSDLPEVEEKLQEMGIFYEVCS